MTTIKTTHRTLNIPIHFPLTGLVDAAWCMLDASCARPSWIEADELCSITGSHGVVVAVILAQEEL